MKFYILTFNTALILYSMLCVSYIRPLYSFQSLLLRLKDWFESSSSILCTLYKFWIWNCTTFFSRFYWDLKDLPSAMDIFLSEEWPLFAITRNWASNPFCIRGMSRSSSTIEFMIFLTLALAVLEFLTEVRFLETVFFLLENGRLYPLMEIS